MEEIMESGLNQSVYQHYCAISIEMLFMLLKESAIFIVVCLCLVGLGITWRFLSIKLGTRIKPDPKKAILITGATSGIGLAVAKHFYKLGFSVIGGYYNDQEAGYKELLEYCYKPDRDVDIKEEENMMAPKLLLVKMDVRSRESIENSAQEIHIFLDENKINLYCLVNNAGTSKDGPFEWCCRESLNDVIDTNLKGVMMVTREFIMDIISNKGRIVNVGSGVFLTPMPSISVYGSCKSAVSYFTASLNEDIKHYGASSVCVLPGNFISNSNIIYPRVKCQQESERKLTDRERKLYQRSISVYKGLLNSSFKNKLLISGDDPDCVAQMYNIDIPELTNRKSKINAGKGFIRWFVGQLDGSIGNGEPLEQSAILEGFQDAICLKNPPQSVFAGNFAYSYISGPSLEFYPRVMYGILTQLSVGSLRNK